MMHDRTSLERARETGDNPRYRPERRMRERRRAAQALRQSEERYRILLDAMAEGVILLDAGGRAQTCNPGAERILELPAEDLLGRGPVWPGWRALCADGRPCTAEEWPVNVTLRTGQPVHNQMVGVRRLDGWLRWLTLNTRPVFEADGRTLRRVVVTFTDVTEARQAADELNQRNAELSTLLEVTRAVSSSLELSEVLRQVATSMARALHMQSCCLSSYDAEARTVTTLVEYDARGQSDLSNLGAVYSLAEYPATARVLAPETFGNRVLAPETFGNRVLAPGGAPRVVRAADPAADPAELALLRRYGDEVLLMLPLQAGGRVVGLAELFDADPGRDFTPRELRLAQALADQAAVASENAWLHLATQQARRRAEVLREANLALSRSLDLEEVLRTSLKALRGLIGHDRAEVLLLDDAPRVTLWVGRSREQGAEVERVEERSFGLDECQYLSEIMATRQSRLIPRTRQVSMWPAWTGQQASAQVCWMGVPLVAGGQVIGMFSVESNNPESFTAEHLQLAEAMAAQAAVAIRNAQLFAELRAGRERLHWLSRRLLTAQEEERRRVSLELHDQAGQALTALKIKLELIRADLPEESGALRREMAEAVSLTDATLEDIRLLAHNLRPPALDTLGLNLALEGFCREFARHTRLAIDYRGEPLPPLSGPASMALYRFLQESLTNVARHANASRVSVSLWRDSRDVLLRVEDNGRGAHSGPEPGEAATGESGTAKAGIGLIGMQERLELLGGCLVVEPCPVQGMRLTAQVPCVEQAPQENALQMEADR